MNTRHTLEIQHTYYLHPRFIPYFSTFKCVSEFFYKHSQNIYWSTFLLIYFFHNISYTTATHYYVLS